MTPYIYLFKHSNDQSTNSEENGNLNFDFISENRKMPFFPLFTRVRLPQKKMISIYLCTHVCMKNRRKRVRERERDLLFIDTIFAFQASFARSSNQ